VANSGKASATSSTIITGEPNEFVRQIHTRMPVIYRKSIATLGSPVQPEKKSWSLTRRIA
jgi:hypothetical protein